MKRNQYIDAIKAIACIFVVLIHCMFPGDVGLCFRALARFAVPLFFMVSGYFLFSSDRKQMNKSMPRKIRHLLWLILISGIGYFILEVAKSIVLEGDSFVIKDFFGNNCSWELVLRLFITNTPLVYMPRWFLYALIYCYLFLMLFNRMRIGNKWLYCISGLLLIGLFVLESVSTVVGTNWGFYVGDSEVFITIRNIFLFRALPWFVLGMVLKEFRSKLEPVSVRVYWGISVIGVIITIIQALLMGDMSVYLGSVLIVFGIFGIAIKKENTECNRFVTHIGNKLSLYVYILHGAVIDAFALLEKLLFNGAEKLLFAWMKPVLVIIISIVVAEIVFRFSTLIKKKGKN